MKTQTIKFTCFTCALAAALALLAGCASSPNQKGVATSNALSASADAVAQTSTSVTDALAALNNLTFKSQGDLRTQFDAFVAASRNLDNSIARLDSRVTALQSAATTYLDNWTNQTATIQNEALRQHSLDRKAEVASQLSDVTASYQGVKDALRPLTSDFRDIQTFLGTDLTAAGLAAIKDTVSKTKVDAVPLRDSIKKLQASFSSLSAALAPTLPGAEQK